MGRGVANLFTGLVRDANDGSPMTISTKSGRAGNRLLVSSAASRGVQGSRYLTFSYLAFEEAMLMWTKELRPEDVFPDAARRSRDELAVAEGRLVDLDHRLATYRQSLVDDPDFATLVGVVRQLEGERVTLAAAVERLRAELHLSRDGVVTHAVDLVEMLGRADEEARFELKTRLRGALASLISEIWVLVGVLDRTTRQAMVQVHFRRGGTRRLVILTEKGRMTSWGQPELQADQPPEWDLRHWGGRGL